MIEFRCKIPGSPSDYFVAGLVKSIERNNDLIKFLNPSQKGIRNKHFIKFCEREYNKRNFKAEPSISQIESEFGIEFCFILKTRNTKRIEKLPSFAKPVVFIQTQQRGSER